MMNFFHELWIIMLDLAPWLLLGMLVAGILHVMLPRDFVRRQLGGRGGVWKAVIFGIPLPLCSCGVIPAGLGLKKDGASHGAAVGFLISTPQTGVDSILVSSSFLGWPFALFKVLSAGITGLVGGWLTNAVQPGKSAAAVASAPAGEPVPRTVRELVTHALEILRSIWLWIVFGVVASAAISAFVPMGTFEGLAAWGALVPMLAMLLVSLPLYVCATASVPIAAALVASGMPAGAALVFLMAGPATNLATIGAIYRGLGGRALGVYLSTIIGGSVLAGWLFDFVLVSGVTAPAHQHGTTAWWAVASVVLLLALIGWFAAEDLLRFIRRLGASTATGDAVEIGVDGMTCQNCVAKLEHALLRENGVTSVAVSLDPGRAVVRGGVDESRLRVAIEEAGFQVVDPSASGA